MILITGAAGKTGKAIIPILAGNNAVVRALVRHPADEQALRDLGVAQVMIGDMENPEDLLKATRGVSSVYLICPNVNPRELEIGQAALKAATANGVDHFVYHSVLHPQIETMPHHWLKMRLEEKIFESGLVFTILQPAAYMQNVLGGWGDITQNRTYFVPYALETRLSMVDLEDVAEVAARVLMRPLDHANAIFELGGPESLSQLDVAQELAEQLGYPVMAKVTDRKQWAAKATESGMDEYSLSTLLKMFVYYEKHGLFGNPRVLEMLLQRPATSFRGFIRRVLVQTH